MNRIIYKRFFFNCSILLYNVDELVNGLAENDLDNYTHLLTGYVGSASFLRRIAEVIKSLKKKNPNLIYGKLE